MKSPRQVVWDAIKIIEALGIKLMTGNWIVRGPEGNVTEVCACGAILAALGIPQKVIDHKNYESEGSQVIRAVAKKLGITLDQAISLNNGFEDAGRGLTYAHGAYDLKLQEDRADAVWYSLGMTLRKRAVIR